MTMKIIFIVLIGSAFAFSGCLKCGCDGGPHGRYPRPYYINSYYSLSNKLLVNYWTDSACFKLWFIYDSVFDATISYHEETSYNTYILKNREHIYTNEEPSSLYNVVDSYYITSYDGGKRFQQLQQQNKDVYNITEPAIGGAILDTIKQINLYMKNDKPTNTADSELCVNAYFTVMYQSFDGYMGRKLNAQEQQNLSKIKTEPLEKFNQSIHPYCRNGHRCDDFFSNDLYRTELYKNNSYDANWTGIQLKPLASYQQPISKMRIEVITTSGKVCSGIYTKE